MTSRHARDETLDRAMNAASSSSNGIGLPPGLSDAIQALGHDHGPAFSFTIAPEPESVTCARHFTRTMLERWDMTTLIDDVGLVVTELVTNALRHSLPPRPAEPEDTIHLRLICRYPYLLCGIQDAGENPPMRREPDYIAETGRGLHIVESFSNMWGWIRCGGGKVVWALFRLPTLSAGEAIRGVNGV